MGSTSVAMIIAVLAGLVFSLVVHECAHGLVALWLGDDTAKRLGRLTLNPVPHIDPFMSIVLPLLMLLMGGGIFGGARPVPVNADNFRMNRYVGMMLVAAAGPLSNILLAILATLLINLVPLVAAWNQDFAIKCLQWLFQLIGVNLVLALFNLLPLPPLDGSKIVAVCLPRRVADWMYTQQAQLAGLVLIALLVQFGYTSYLAPALEYAILLLIKTFVFVHQVSV